MANLYGFYIGKENFCPAQMIYFKILCGIKKKVVFLQPQTREFSSAGLERLLDREEVSGPNPLTPTRDAGAASESAPALLFLGSPLPCLEWGNS